VHEGEWSFGAKGQAFRHRRGRPEGRARQRNGFSADLRSLLLFDPDAETQLVPTMAFANLLEDVLDEPCDGLTAAASAGMPHLVGNRRPPGWPGKASGPNLPLRRALQEKGLQVGPGSLSREDGKFHQIPKGLVLLFHS